MQSTSTVQRLKHPSRSSFWQNFPCNWMNHNYLAEQSRVHTLGKLRTLGVMGLRLCSGPSSQQRFSCVSALFGWGSLLFFLWGYGMKNVSLCPKGTILFIRGILPMKETNPDGNIYDTIYQLVRLQHVFSSGEGGHHVKYKENIFLFVVHSSVVSPVFTLLHNRSLEIFNLAKLSVSLNFSSSYPSPSSQPPPFHFLFLCT